jgi:hypothetical protein
MEENMSDRVIKLSKSADLGALRSKLSDPKFVSALSKNPSRELAKYGVEVDAVMAKAIREHLGLIPKGESPHAALVSVIVSVVI